MFVEQQQCVEVCLGRYKSRLVAGGHVLSPTLDVVYSGVVSLRAPHLLRGRTK